MKTEIISVDKNVDEKESYEQAVEIIRNGEVVAFPTETVYGLGADATNWEFLKQKAVRLIIH